MVTCFSINQNKCPEPDVSCLLQNKPLIFPSSFFPLMQGASSSSYSPSPGSLPESSNSKICQCFQRFNSQHQEDSSSTPVCSGLHCSRGSVSRHTETHTTHIHNTHAHTGTRLSYRLIITHSCTSSLSPTAQGTQTHLEHGHPGSRAQDHPHSLTAPAPAQPRVSTTTPPILTDSPCSRDAQTDPAPLLPPPRLTRCWYRLTFPKPPVPSRSRISQGPLAPGRSPGGRSMERERQPPQALPPVQGRFRAAEASESFVSRDCVTSALPQGKSRPELLESPWDWC